MPRFFSSLILGLMAVMLVCALSACNGGEENAESAANKPDGRPVVGILVYDASDVYVSSVIDHLEALLSHSYDLIIKDGAGDKITQMEQLNSLLDGQVSILLLNLVEPQSAALVVDKLKQADVPGVFFNREPDLVILKGYPQSAFVGTTIFEAGIMQGAIIADLWQNNPRYDRNGDGMFQYLMFQGEPDNAEALARSEYSVKEARERGVKMQQLGQTHVCNWRDDLAREAMILALANGIGDIELVISNNDVMALGAIEALQGIGYNLEGGDPANFIPVVGVDAVPQAVSAIRNGVMSATVKQDGEAMAEAIAALAENLLAGKDMLEGTPYQWDGSGVAIRIPYSQFNADSK